MNFYHMEGTKLGIFEYKKWTSSSLCIQEACNKETNKNKRKLAILWERLKRVMQLQYRITVVILTKMRKSLQYYSSEDWGIMSRNQVWKWNSIRKNTLNKGKIQGKHWMSLGHHSLLTQTQNSLKGTSVIDFNAVQGHFLEIFKYQTEYS